MTIYRKYTRKLGLHRGGSSFPYISGDTYKALCNLKYEGDDKLISEKIATAPELSNTKLFLPLPLIGKFLKWLDSNNYDLLRFHLYIHNGDLLPELEDLERLSARFGTIFCVNWIGQSSKILAIPIGLENRRLHTNGVPSDFTKLIRLGVPNSESRKNQILVSFSISTNVAERSSALENAKQFSKVDLRFFQGSVAGYHQELLRSRFVLSPPGNGFDCHRTWEAIYLGAIPIVKKKFWPFSHLNLPVLVVEDWSELSHIHLRDLPGQISVEGLKSLFLEF
jgi:hypothetical protein